jgi:hypothetical protein
MRGKGRSDVRIRELDVFKGDHYELWIDAARGRGWRRNRKKSLRRMLFPPSI